MDECPVCLEPLSGTITIVGCCKKSFHAGCLNRCVREKNKCPMCRVKDCIVNIPVAENEGEDERAIVLREATLLVLGTFMVTLSIFTVRVFLHV
jgi:hypothetical protein